MPNTVILYHCSDEIIVVRNGDDTFNEQVMVRAMFKSTHDDTPEHELFVANYDYVGDRNPDEYEREVVKTGDDPFVIISLTTKFTFS